MRIIIANVKAAETPLSYERRLGYGGGFKPCPVEMGKEYEVGTTETSHKREGIGSKATRKSSLNGLKTF